MAAAVNLYLAGVVARDTHGVQKGFVAGRKFGEHIVALDAECRQAGLLPAADERLPGFFSFDVRAAFPSMSQLFLRRTVERFRLPPPITTCSTGWRTALSDTPEWAKV